MAGQAAPAITQVWLRRGLAAWLLSPLSVLFGALVAVRRQLYRMGTLKSHRLPVPVLVVGNVLAGGTGKTPVVMAVVRHLQARGLQVGIVSRGYGRDMSAPGAGDCMEVTPNTLSNCSGDEPALMKRALSAPVFVANRRIEAARALLARYPATQCLVSDDGLQHYALQRDVEICVFDARGTGNGWLLPAGPLREAWPRQALGTGGQTVPTGLVLTSGPRVAGDAPQFKASRELSNDAMDATGRRTPLDSLRGRPVDAVAAIARPEQFFDMLRGCGLQLAHTEALPDHYDFNSWICPFDKGFPLICTEKDAVKLWARYPQALAVPLTVKLDPAFWAALDSALDQASSRARR